MIEETRPRYFLFCEIESTIAHREAKSPSQKVNGKEDAYQKTDGSGAPTSVKGTDSRKKKSDSDMNR